MTGISGYSIGATRVAVFEKRLASSKNYRFEEAMLGNCIY